MAVYVDDMAAPFGRLVMCHMIADSTEELNAMADQVGVDRKWIQDAGTWREHYDICKTKKAKAIALGAQQITMRDLAHRCLQRARQQRESKPLKRGAPVSSI